MDNTLELDCHSDTPLNLDLLDEALVVEARMGDADAFGRLLDRHYQFALSKAWSIMRNRGDAEDAVQNACAEAWKNIGQLRGANFSAWFSRIVLNACLMQLRRRKRLVSICEETRPGDSFQVRLIDHRATPEEELGDVQVSNILMKEIRGIPFLLRRVLIMRDLWEMPLPDIATRLNISISGAKSRLMRARIELRNRLEKYLGQRRSTTLHMRSGRLRTKSARVA